MPKVKLTKPRRAKEPKCPECDKVKAAQPQSQAIGEFIDWLAQEKNIALAHVHEHTDACYTHGMNKRQFRLAYSGNPRCSREELRAGRFDEPQCGMTDGELHFCHVRIENLLADFFGIDLKKRALEQDKLLAYIRRQAECELPVT